MAIDPKLVSIKEAKDLPTAEAKSTSDFLFFEDQVLKKSPMSNIYDKVTSGIKGIATQTNAPTPYSVETYPNGLTEIWRVFDPLTSPNSWGNIAVTQAELNANDIYFVVTNGVVAKKPSPKTIADPAKLPLYSAIKSANIISGTQFVDDENGDIMYRVMTGQTLLSADIPANVVGTKVEIINPRDDNYFKRSAPILANGYINLSGSTVVFNRIQELEFKSGRAETQEGDVWQVKGRGGANAPRLWGFAKEDGSIISISGISVIAPNYIQIIAPPLAKYVYFNFATAEGVPAGDAYRESVLPSIVNNANRLNSVDSKLAKIDAETPVFSYGTADTKKGWFRPVNGATVGAESDNAAYETFSLPVKKGDFIITKGRGGASPKTWALADASGNILRSSTTAQNAGTVPAYISVTEDSAAVIYFNNTITSEFYIHKTNLIAGKIDRRLRKTDGEIYIAAYNSPEIDKFNADVVCTGVNDEITLTNAINSLTNGGKVYLYPGYYMIDSFPTPEDGADKTAIFLKNNGINRMFEIVSTQKPQFALGRKCANLIVSNACWESLDPDEARSIIRGSTGVLNFQYQRPTSFILKDIIMTIPNNSKRINMVDHRYSTTGGMEGVVMWASTDANYDFIIATSRGPIPHSKCVGWKGFLGSNSAYYTKISDCTAWGYGEGFSIGADHVVLERCLAKLGTYGYTFGTFSITYHTTTLIKCLDEANSNLPFFGDNGGMPGSVNFIDFTTERIANRSPIDGLKAVEATPGRWKGKIDYSYGARFFEEGSGLNITATDKTYQTHGNTLNRQTFRGNANRFNKFYDTDLNKELIWDGTAWRDAMGNIIP